MVVKSDEILLPGTCPASPFYPIPTSCPASTFFSSYLIVLVEVACVEEVRDRLVSEGRGKVWRRQQGLEVAVRSGGGSKVWRCRQQRSGGIEKVWCGSFPGN
jgi:hypothetical protein